MTMPWTTPPSPYHSDYQPPESLECVRLACEAEEARHALQVEPADDTHWWAVWLLVVAPWAFIAVFFGILAGVVRMNAH